ncbi:MAG: AEC family transporter [Caldilineaceae bacterium]|nr:AEC family transporter [Caldilineaceae bacterium]
MSVAQSLLPIFIETVLPVFLIAFAGYLLAWRMTIDGRSLGRLLFYLATPSLVFRSLYTTEVDLATMQQVALIAVAVYVLAGIAGWLVGFDQPRRERMAIVMTSAISNNGNMGIPICFFAFGDIGLALGTLYYVVASFLNNTVGVVVASSGEAPLGRALRNSLQVPVLYAAIVGLLLNQLGGEVPVPIYRAVDLMADAAVPGMLALLGIQLRAAPLFQRQAVIWRSSLIRLVAAPLLALLLCIWLAVGGVQRDVIVLQAAMPTAVMSAVLATEYDTAPQLVAAVIFMTTLISMGTLSVVLGLIL